MAVILFHAGLAPFSGGFIGVDVFFVLSGYLITTLILRDLAAGQFSLLSFYDRRARRILPALFVMVAATIVAAWFLLLPTDMEEFSESLIGVALFLSNMVFWDQAGYFSTAAELKPLLHTWSLAVEEQFYILFPLILMAVWRFGVGAVAAIVALLFGASLAYAHHASTAAPNDAFFLITARAWELALGAGTALCLRMRPDLARARGAPVASTLGLAMVVLPIFAFDKSTPTPGLAFLIPTLGTALVIAFNAPGTPVFRALALRPMVAIGLISYSAYLWHQPLFAFTRHATVIDLALPLIAILILATLALAWLSYRFIEQPVRHGRVLATRTPLFAASLAGLVAMAGVGVMGDQSDGFRDRFDLTALPSRWDVPCHGDIDLTNPGPDLDRCLGTAPDGIPGTIFLLGDSHAAQLTFPLRAVADSRGVPFAFVNAHDGAFFPYTFIEQNPAPESVILDRIIALSDPGDILILAFHAGRLNADRDVHLPLDRAPAITQKATAMRANLERQIPALKAAGLRLVYILDTPLLPEAANIERCALHPDTQDESGCTIARDQTEWSRKPQSDIFLALARAHPEISTVFDPNPTLFGDGLTYGPVRPDGTFRMFDRHHITEDEAMRLQNALDAALP